MSDNQLGVAAYRDEDDEWRAFDRMPASLRRYLVEDCPIDFSSEEVLEQLDDRGVSFLVSRLRWEAIQLLNQDIAEQRRRYPKLQWPVADERNTRPIRKQIRKATFRN